MIKLALRLALAGLVLWGGQQGVYSQDPGKPQKVADEPEATKPPVVDLVAASLTRLKVAKLFCFDDDDDPRDGKQSPTLFHDELVLLESAHPLARFEELLAQGTLAGKVYALCGLYFCSEDRFQAEIEKLKKSPLHGMVKTMEIDLIGGLDFMDLVDGTENEAIRLRYGETLDEFASRSGHLGADDLAGGGTPIKLMDEGRRKRPWPVDGHPFVWFSSEELDEFLEARRKFYALWLHARQASALDLKLEQERSTNASKH